MLYIHSKELYRGFIIVPMHDQLIEMMDTGIIMDFIDRNYAYYI